jgi:hypothetical protein
MDEMMIVARTSTRFTTVFTPADPEHSDNEINEQVIPPAAWTRLCNTYRAMKNAQFHRGRFAEKFMDYLNGLADGLELDRMDLLERVKEVAG